ncbi:hypothetical protein [Paludibaculum fermentans]|uniref:Uncharacterized protein n=1 Tax=Paludibaculum fermentans TaxID=1473598 RepID=A0A7S7SJX1_PALFE|nr:hypothetical protein [Paludibaculum fermentans]QOY87699.1 hypothetical protein IRI77_33950 [Paludibaculum fermentans]
MALSIELPAQGEPFQGTLPSNLAAVALLTSAAFLGGWPWALMAAILVVTLRTRESGGWAMLQAAAGGLFWLALFHWTGDRRLFFPFSMQVAASAACLWRINGKWAAVAVGALVTGVFAGIRLLQSASAHVLGVELIVAAVVLAAGLALLPYTGRWGASTAAALLALAGLLI